MTKYAENIGNINKNAPDYICSADEFIETTEAVNGSTLIVVDESEKKVAGYYIAFNGTWIAL